MTARLHLHEEILLLALKDREGTIEFGCNYQYAVGGAILAELLMAERLRAVQVKKNKHLVEVVDATPLGEPLLDECLGRVAAAKRRASLETWVSRFAGLKGLKHRVAASLVDRGVLLAERDTVMLLFSRTVYPEADPGPERELEARLEAAIFGGGTEVEPRTVVMIALARAADLLRHHFDKRALKERQARIEALVNGELTGAATAAAIQAAETAILVASMVPVMVAATSS